MIANVSTDSPAVRSPKASRAVLALILLAATLLYAAFILRTGFHIAGITYFTLVDDAMVSMRYARHLAQGYGLVWNIGGKPVEGFTNPGWMLLLALLHLLPLPLSKVSLAVMIVSALILLAHLLVIYKIASLLHPAWKGTALVATGITAFYFPLVFWTLRGMEVGLIVLLIDAAVLISLQIRAEASLSKLVLLAALLSLAVLVRLDALLQVIILLAYLLYVRRVTPRGVWIPLLAVILTTAVILLFQRLYFGDFLPNTYYQKMGGTSVLERIHYGLLAFYEHAAWDTLFPALFCIAALALYPGFRRPEVLLLLALFAAQCAYSIWVGGDYAEVEVDSANRFITQGMPALIMLFSLGVDHLLSEARLKLGRKPAVQAALGLGLAILALAIMSSRPWLAWASDNAPLLKADIRRTRLGLFIARNTAPQAVIAVHAAGQIPYYSQRQTIDLLGLNDPVVAKGPVTGPFYPGHDKWNYEYSILQLRPDLIADNWIKLGTFMKDKAEYRHLDNGIYVRMDSPYVDFAGISAEYR